MKRILLLLALLVPASAQAFTVSGRFLYEDRLRIVAGRFEAEHRRRKKGDPEAPLPEHRNAKLAAVHGERAKLYEKREQILKLGKHALALLTAITHREGPRSKASVEALYALLVEHGDEAMRAAIERAVTANRSSVAGVRAQLTSSDRALGADRARELGASTRSSTGTKPRRVAPKRGGR